MPTMTIEKFESMLAVDKNNLDTEVERHAEYAGAIAREVAMAEEARDDAAEELKRVEAREYLKIKDSAEKVTEAEAKASVMVQQKRIDSADRLQLAEHQLSLWKGLQEAWKQRGYGIRVLTDLYQANYFQLSSSATSRADREDGRLPRRNRG